MIKKQGINMESVRNSNRAAILSYLNTFGASSRKKIAQDLNLTTATLTIITNELINEGLLIEVGEVSENRAGRRQILIDINSNSKFCLGLEIQKKKIVYVITDLKANIIQEKEWIIDSEVSHIELQKILSYVEETSKNIIKDIIGIGILVQGQIENNYALSSPIPDIYYILKEKFNLECIIENNMLGLVMSELYFRKDLQNFWLLKYGPGVGSSVIIDRKILKGSYNKPIELGHTLLFHKNHNHYCSICKKNGCLESEVHFYNIVKELEDRKYKKYKNESELEFIERVALYEKNSILEEKLLLLSNYLVMIAGAIPTKDLVICGEIFSNIKYLELFKKNLKSKVGEKFFENITYMDNYSYKRKIAGAILVIEKFFR